MWEMVKDGTVTAENYLATMEAQGWDFLWIKNIWMPDIAARIFGSGSMVVPSAEFANVAAHGITEVWRYNDVMNPIANLLGNVANGYFILPLLAGGTQYLATLITPKADPAGAQNSSMKMMQYVFPLIFVYFTMTSTAAIALYWVTSNIISIISQYVITRVLMAKDKKAEAASLEGGNVEYEIH
jgi:membrane protein insertase Oxa1/YidC/SpoIIIJ